MKLICSQCGNTADVASEEDGRFCVKCVSPNSRGIRMLPIGAHPAGPDAPVTIPEDLLTRRRILETAVSCVCRDRNNLYGSPEDNFAQIAARWNAHIKNKYGIDIVLDPTSVAIMMTDVKLARIEHNPSVEDSWIDAAGYVACGAGIELVKKPKQGKS